MPKKPSIPVTAVGLRTRAEQHLRVHQTKPIPKRTAADARRTLHELEVHRIELEMQNAELVATRDKLEAALARYTNLYDFALVGYLSLDESGVILEANLTSAAMLGMERSRILNRRLPVFLSPISRPIFLAFLEKVFAGIKNQVCEAIILKAGDDTFWADFRAVSPITLNEGRQCCQFLFGEITAKKQAAKLTPRELEVLQFIAEGKPNKESAAILGTSTRTIEKHREQIIKKLDIHDTAGLTRFAISAGIIKNSV